MAAKLNFVNILIYLWIILLYIIISKIFFGLFWLFYKAMGMIGIDIEPTVHYVGSYNSPVVGPLAHLYDAITPGPMMIIWSGIFVGITFLILVFMIIWLIFGGFPFYLKDMSPFKELTPIFKAILNRIPFKPIFIKYNMELTSLLLKKNSKTTLEKFSSKKEHIDNDFYNDIKNYYKMRDNYYIGAYKSYKHSDEASLFKTYKIITPDMDDNEVSGVISENNTVAARISSLSMISKKNKI